MPQELIKKFREEDLGGRMFSGTFGSAPASPEVIQWLEEVLGFPPINGYGSTEGGMIMLDNKIQHKCAPDQASSAPKRPGLCLPKVFLGCIHGNAHH